MPKGLDGWTSKGSVFQRMIARGRKLLRVADFCKGDRIGVLSEWIARCARYEGRKCLVPPIFSASKPILHTACVTHNQMFSLGRRQGSFGVVSLRTLLDTFSGRASDILLSMLPLLWKELRWLDRFFLAQKEDFPPWRLQTCNSGLKLVQTLMPVPGWITLQVTFETLDRSALPAELEAH